MKKIIILVLIIIGTQKTYAQVDNLRQDLDFLFGQLDKTKVTSGYLAPYGLDAVNKEAFNGILTDSNVVNSMDLFRFIYADIYSAKFNPTAISMPSVEGINQTFSQNNVHSLALIYANYEVLNEAAVQQGFLSYSGGKLYDNTTAEAKVVKPGAYVSKKLFAANPVTQSFKNTVTLRYSPSLFFTNTNATIQSLEINFGNGYQLASPNTDISNTYYDSSGFHKIAIKAYLSNGDILETYTAVTVEVTNNTASRYSFANLDNPDITITETATQSGCKVYIRRSVNTIANTTNSTSILKPFIVVEGLDTHNGAPGLDKTNYDVNNLIQELDGVLFNNNRATVNFDDIGQYDLIFIDWNNGVDDIRRNAATLELVLNAVSNLKIGTQQNVVMGISMGGLVARYCLADMTKRGLNTQTRLLISHDSPHQGAYVPLALQHLITGLQNKTILNIRLGSIMGVLDQGVTLLNSTAAQQQLLMTSADGNGAVSLNTFLQNIYRPMITFAASDPQPQYQFIATSQGSQCGIGTIPVGGNLANGEAQGSAGSVATFLTQGLVTRLRLKVTINAKGLSANGLQNEILYFRFRREATYLFGLIPANKNLIELHRNEPNIPNPIPWESVPGGTIGFPTNTPFAFAGNWNILSLGFLGYDYRFTTASQFSFVPTISALDVINPAAINQSSIFGINATFTGISAFKASKIIAQQQVGFDFNIPHTDFTSRNSKWLFEEMQNINHTLDCNDFCTSNEVINGPDNLCSQETYTINVPANTNVTWSAIPSDIVTLTPNGSSVTVTKLWDGVIKLRATINNNCIFNTTIEKDIQVGLPAKLPGIFSNLAPAGNYHILQLDEDETNLVTPGPTWTDFTYYPFTNLPMNTTISLTASYPVPPNDWYKIWHSDSKQLFINMPANTWALYKLSYPAFCGTAEFNISYYSWIGTVYRIVENPSSNTLRIVVDKMNIPQLKTKQVLSQEIRVVSITDKSGNQMLSKNYPSNTEAANVDISILKPDVYFVNISDGKNMKTLTFTKL